MAPIDGPYTTYYWSAIVNSSILHMGRCVTWVAIIRWVTWVMGQWVLTHDPSFFFNIWNVCVAVPYSRINCVRNDKW